MTLFLKSHEIPFKFLTRGHGFFKSCSIKRTRIFRCRASARGISSNRLFVSPIFNLSPFRHVSNLLGIKAVLALQNLAKSCRILQNLAESCRILQNLAESHIISLTRHRRTDQPVQSCSYFVPYL